MSAKAKSAARSDPKRLAYQFIIFMGIVSLFGDITYEGARGITGPFLATLGASAAVVGLVAGLGAGRRNGRLEEGCRIVR